MKINYFIFTAAESAITFFITKMNRNDKYLKKFVKLKRKRL